MAKKPTHHDAHRSAQTGQFVTPQQANRSPATTVKERVPNPGRGEHGKKSR